MTTAHRIPVTWLSLQVYLGGAWQDAGYAEHDPDRGTVTVGYFRDYAERWFQQIEAAFSISFLPDTLRKRYANTLPGFLADLLPQGEGYRRLREHFAITGYGVSDAFRLLAIAAGNPIGNVRVKEAHDWLTGQCQIAEPRGFCLEELISEGALQTYLDSAIHRVAGAQALQGEWPKALMTQAEDGLFYLDHELPDIRSTKHFLIKFPRQDAASRFTKILASEAHLHQQAEALGFVVHGTSQLHSGYLLVERFDRAVADGKVLRIGQESLLSALDCSHVIQLMRHDTVLPLLVDLDDSTGASAVEYILRDAWNVLVDNRDNHGRNTAIQRLESGRAVLSPLFDVNRSHLHPGWLARTMRWQEHENNGRPRWCEIIAQIPDPAQRDAANARLELLFQHGAPS